MTAWFRPRTTVDLGDSPGTVFLRDGSILIPKDAKAVIPK